MNALHDCSVEKNVFLISASALVTLGLRSLLERCAGNCRGNGSATTYPPEDMLSLSNADLIVFDCADTEAPRRIGEIATDIEHTFGKPLLLLADAPRLDAIRNGTPTGGCRIVDRNAASEVLIDAIETCLSGEPLAAPALPADDVRRREARVAVQIPVRLNAETCMTRNLSARGMYIELQEATHTIGETVLIEIDLHSPEGDSTLSLSGEIVRKELIGGRVGLGVRILASGMPHKKKPAMQAGLSA